MIFLTDDDLATQIQPDQLQVLTGGDSTLLDSAEQQALAEAEEYLAIRYDVAEAYAPPSPTPRNMMLVRHITSLTLFYLLGRVAPNKIPDLRIKAYEAAKWWLKDCSEGKRSPKLPLKKDPDTGEVSNKDTPFRMVSHPKENNNY